MKVIYVDGHSRDTGPPFESDVSDSSGRVCASEARMLAVPYFMSSLRAHLETLVSLRAHGLCSI